jgi:hypothetical protein
MVKCEACDSDTASYYEVKGKKLCLSCYTDISQDKSQIKKENVLKSISDEYTPSIDNKEKIKIKPQRTNLGILLRVCGVLSAIIIFFVGLQLMSLRSVSGESVAEAYYQGIGLFMIGLSLFIGPLLWGLANLVERK